MQLTPDQRRAVEQLKTGRSYAVYGVAGTGKEDGLFTAPGEPLRRTRPLWP